MSKYGESLPDLIEDAPLFSIEAEQATLGSCLLSPRACADIVASTKAEQFTRPAHRLIFKAIVGLVDLNKDVDLTTVYQELKDRGTLSLAGGMDYLSELDLSVSSVSSAPSYLGIVKDKDARRAGIDLAEEIVRALRTNRPLSEVEQMGIGLAARIAAGKRRKPDLSWRDAMAIHDEEQDPGAVSSGNAQLDGIMPYGGLTNGQITLSTAPTGAGKTTWAMGATFRALDRGCRCAILNFADNNLRDFRERAMRYKCGLPSRRSAIRKARALADDGEMNLAESLLSRYDRAKKEVDAWDLEVFDACTNDEGGDFETARAWLLRKVDEGKPMSLAIWDYAQEIAVADGSVAKATFYAQQRWLASQMARLCKRLDFAFIVCGQLTEVGDGKEVFAECKMWEKVCELYLRIHDDGLEIRKRRRGGRTSFRPGHKYHEERWIHVPDCDKWDDAIGGPLA